MVVAYGLSCSVACGIFLDQGSNLYLLLWQADSLPLRYQGSPYKFVLTFTFRSAIHLDVIFIYGVRQGSRFIFPFHMDILLTQYH